jgi:hypothetical protein
VSAVRLNAEREAESHHTAAARANNRFVRWARRGVWENLFRALAGSGRSAATQMMDCTHVKAHRS